MVSQISTAPSATATTAVVAGTCTEETKMVDATVTRFSASLDHRIDVLRQMCLHVCNLLPGGARTLATAAFRVGDKIGLSADDLTIMRILLLRYRRSADACLALPLSPRQQLIAASFVSQSMLYDDPISKATWEAATATSWPLLTQHVLLFLQTIEYDVQFSPDDYCDALRAMLADVLNKAGYLRHAALHPQLCRSTSLDSYLAAIPSS